MKIIREVIEIEKGRSFRLFKPSLRNKFMWHYHPEIELVYIEAQTGIRHVGQHVSSYLESDLVLIGSNIPHLNFDYGLQTEYNQIVLQLKEDFLGSAIAQSPEFEPIKKLFDQSMFGLSFHGKTKELVKNRLAEISKLNHLAQLLELVSIFDMLAHSDEVTVLNDSDTSVRFFYNDKIRMAEIYDYIYERYQTQTDVNEIAAKVHLNTSTFCRYFKKQTKMTFTDFVNQYRINRAKTLLLQDKSVTETCYAVGFESLSYFNKLFKKWIGENPSAFKSKYLKN